MSIKRLIAGLAATPLVAALAMPLTAFAATTSTVTPLNTQGWSTADTRTGGSVNYITDTSAPGGSALQLKTDSTTAAKAQYMHSTNTKLSDVTALGYATKQVNASIPEGDASFQLPVCLTGINTTTKACNPKTAEDTTDPAKDSFTTLVFEPYVSEGSSAVQSNVWQTWNVKNGKFWSSRSVGTLVGAPGDPNHIYSLQEILTEFPDAVATAFGVNVGTYNTDYTINVDSVVFNDATYDFQTATTPTDKDKCKNDGWKNFNSPTFKNQGDCVSFVASAKTSNYKLDSGNKDGLNIPTTKGAYYEVTVKGTWTNRPGEVVDAECTNTLSDNWQNAVAGGSYSPDLLDVQVNKAFVDWGSCDATGHSYTKWVVADDNSMNLRVFDGNTADGTLINDWYNDNVGSLNVTVVAHKI
jgi:hypothetical protein